MAYFMFLFARRMISKRSFTPSLVQPFNLTNRKILSPQNLAAAIAKPKTRRRNIREKN